MVAVNVRKIIALLCEIGFDVKVGLLKNKATKIKAMKAMALSSSVDD